MLNRSYVSCHDGHPHHISDQDVKSLKKAFKDVGKNQGTIQILKTLSDPTKLSIYLLLHRVDEIPVTDIGLILDLSQSAVSHALSDLKKLFFFNDTATTEIYTLSLHDALPIWPASSPASPSAAWARARKSPKIGRAHV